MKRKTTYSWALKHAGHITSIARALGLPMVRPILDSMDSHRGAVFYVLGPTQVFKTLVGQLRALRSMQVEPQPSLWYGPTDRNVEDFVGEKFNPLFDECAPLQDLLFDDPSKRAKQRINFPLPTYFLILTAGTEANRNSKTACDLYMDEPWQYDPGWIDEIERRRSDYSQDFREVFMTTGPETGTHAARIWENTDQRRWHFRCPKCDAFFEPRFAHRNDAGDLIGGIRFDTVLRADGLPDEAAIQASTVYECPRCHLRLAPTPGSKLALNGTADQPRGLFIQQNSSPSPKHFGWQVNGCALREWGPIACKFVYAQLARERGDLEPMKNLITLDFADLWDDRAYYSSKSTRQVGDYMMGDEWDGELKDQDGRPWRFCTIDVQQDHYYLLITMWGRFSESRCRFAAKVMSPSDIEAMCIENKVEPFRVFIDARYEPQRVRRIAALMGWTTMMGDRQNARGYHHPDGIYRIFDEAKVYDPLIGTPDQGKGRRVLEILFSKQAALNRLHVLRTEKIQPRRPDGATEDPPERPLWSAAANMPDWFWPQMEAHYRKKKVNSDGSEYWVWEGLKEDHIGDCAVEAVVVASASGLTGAESLEAAPIEIKIPT